MHSCIHAFLPSFLHSSLLPLFLISRLAGESGESARGAPVEPFPLGAELRVVGSLSVVGGGRRGVPQGPDSWLAEQLRDARHRDRHGAALGHHPRIHPGTHSLASQLAH